MSNKKELSKTTIQKASLEAKPGESISDAVLNFLNLCEKEKTNDKA
jgi:hypothetical protein